MNDSTHKFPSPGLESVQDLIGQGRLAEAETACQKLSVSAPLDPEPSYCRSLIARRRGDWQECLQHLQRATELAPGCARYHADTGAALFMLGRYGEAAGAYERALAADPNDRSALNNLAVIYSKARRNQDAEALLQRLLALDPEHYNAWLNLCSAVADMDCREADVVAYARRAVALRPREPQPYEFLGRALLKQGNPAEAADCFTTASQLGADKGEAFFRIGLCRIEMEQIPQAVEAFQEALAAEPTHWQTYYALAELLYQFDEAALLAAEEACRQALNHQDDVTGSGTAQQLLAQILFAQGRYAEAIGHYEQFLDLQKAASGADVPSKAVENDLLVVNVASVRDWSVHQGLPVREILPAFEFNARAPIRFGLPSLQAPPPVQVPPAYVSEVADAVVLPGHEVILVDDHRLALFDRLVNLDDWFSFLGYEGIPLAAKGTVAVALPPPAPKGIDAGIFFFGHYWANYAHWLTECLPRLQLLEQVPACDGLPILVNEGLFPQQLESLRLLCADRYPIRILPRTHRVRVDRLVYASDLTASIRMRMRLGTGAAPDDVALHPEAMPFLRDRLIPQPLRNHRATRRLWVSRKGRQGYGQRRLLNEPEIEAWYASQGFETIFPERMSFAEQVETFAQADIVAGNSGAGMINTIFSPPTTRILMFVKDHAQTNYYYFGNIAQTIGQQIVYVCGKPIPNFRVPIYHADFTVDLDLAKRALASVLPS